MKIKLTVKIIIVFNKDKYKCKYLSFQCEPQILPQLVHNFTSIS